ncbi:MAG: SCO2521 family protein [Actinophytocola sp.]|uniref:SCO2521 family protein n=1 Tax=Actinophytocola sp. TaxID=1872138 RepID=UPI003C74504D
MLVIGEVRTCLLQNRAAASSVDVAELLRLEAGERVRTSERPVAYAVSPARLTGLDCRLPTESGARVRGIGTATARTTVTGGRLLQGSVFTRVERGATDRRLPWSHYLAMPGMIQSTGRFNPADVVKGFLTDPLPDTVVDLGSVSEQVIRQVQASARLDHVTPFKARRTRLKWVACTGGPAYGVFTIADDNLRTFTISADAAPIESIVELCEDLALHDWLLTTVQRIVERSRIGAASSENVLTRLRPAIDHLLHLWMPGARVADALRGIWDDLDRRPGFTPQWRSTVARIRDQLSVATFDRLNQLSPTMFEELVSGGGSVGGAR